MPDRTTYAELDDVDDNDRIVVGRDTCKDDALCIALCMSCIVATAILGVYVFVELQKPPPEWMAELGP